MEWRTPTLLVMLVCTRIYNNFIDRTSVASMAQCVMQFPFYGKGCYALRRLHVQSDSIGYSPLKSNFDQYNPLDAPIVHDLGVTFSRHYIVIKNLIKGP